MDYQKYIEDYKKIIKEGNTQTFLKYLNEDIVPPFYFIVSPSVGYGITYESFNSSMLQALVKKYAFLSDNMAFNDGLMKALLKEEKILEFKEFMQHYQSEYKPEKLKEKLQHTLAYLNENALIALNDYLPKSNLTYGINLLTKAFNEKNITLNKVKAIFSQIEIQIINYENIRQCFELPFKHNHEESIDYFKTKFDKFLNKKTRQSSPYMVKKEENQTLTNWEYLVAEFYLAKTQSYNEIKITHDFFENNLIKDKLNFCLPAITMSKLYKYKKIEEMNNFFHFRSYSFEIFDLLININKPIEGILDKLSKKDKEDINLIHLTLNSVKNNNPHAYEESLINVLATKIETIQLYLGLENSNNTTSFKKMKL